MNDLLPLRKWLLGLLMLCVPLLGGCDEMVNKDAVSVSAINYTGKELNAFMFKDPNTGAVAGGVGLSPYEGGGTMCCYSLPHKWHKGIMVKLEYDWWAGSSEKREYQYLTAEIPPYPTDEPGMLWALFFEDGSVQVVASAVDPGHPQWPGRIKHWPVPSREYKLKLWQMDYDEAANLMPYYKELANGISEKERIETWEHYKERRKEMIAGFSGPNDPKFIESLRKYGVDNIATTKQRLTDLEKIKP